jgi:hypothetical protein
LLSQSKRVTGNRLHRISHNAFIEKTDLNHKQTDLNHRKKLQAELALIHQPGFPCNQPEKLLAGSQEKKNDVRSPGFLAKHWILSAKMTTEMSS